MEKNDTEFNRQLNTTSFRHKYNGNYTKFEIFT